MADMWRLEIALNDSPGAVAARDVEREVLLQWFGNTEQQLAAEYGPYTEASIFLVVRDQAGHASGMLRIIRPTTAGLKSLADASRPPWEVRVADLVADGVLDLDRTWDVATLCVKDEHRRAAGGGEVALALYHGLYWLSSLHGVRHWVAVLDDHVLATMRALSFPFFALPGAIARPYLGSPASTPVFADVRATGHAVATSNPSMAGLLLRGEGLHTVDLSLFVRQARALRELG